MPPPGIVFKGNNLATPKWLKDFPNRDRLAVFPALLDVTAFTDYGAQLVTVNAIAAAAAVAVTVLPLPVALPVGLVLNFAPGAGKFAKLTAAAAAGATSIAVEALPTALAVGDVAQYSTFVTKMIRSGTPLGRTFAQRDAGTPFRYMLATDNEFGFLFNDLTEIIPGQTVAQCTVLRPGKNITIAENYLPDWTILNSTNTALRDFLRAQYYMIKGQD
jgi:hypothetical protein